MIKTLASAAIIAAASLTFAAAAQAEDFPAAPMNHGPMMMGGMAFPPVNVNAPLDAMMTSVAPAPAAAPMAEPMRHHMMHHHHMHKKMM